MTLVEAAATESTMCTGVARTCAAVDDAGVLAGAVIFTAVVTVLNPASETTSVYAPG